MDPLLKSGIYIGGFEKKRRRLGYQKGRESESD